jgi:uncharacterized membrane protein YfcA
MNWQHYLVLFGSAALAGAVNSVAGGGTLLTFPALLAVGFSSKIANATSTVALWPGQLSSLFGYRKELGGSRPAVIKLAIPSFLGGVAGAFLLLHTPASTFDMIVPFLILGATLLFMVQEPLARAQKRRIERARAADSATDEPRAAAWAAIMLFQLGVAVYGGYFGAGIGILMLAALGLMGFTNIHRMNGLKNINGLCINAVASVLFITDGLVQWNVALIMACGSIIGGLAGAGTARRLGQSRVRKIIICIGFALTTYMVWTRIVHP